MKVTRIYDDAAVRAVMIQPDMWTTVAEDGQDQDNYAPDVYGDCWLEMEADGNLVGLYQLQKRNRVLVEIHAQVLPEYRKEYSKATGQAALAWIVENLPECQKIIAWVPVIYQNVIDFTVGQGFTIEGLNRKSYFKNGKLHDQKLLGITRNEVEQWAQ